MADDVDRADDRIQALIDDALAAVKRFNETTTKYHTECNWCGDPTEDGARYCCKDCATDHMRYNSARKRNGEVDD